MTSSAMLDLIRALTDGSHPQTQFQLRDRHGYCFVGVATDLFGTGTWVQARDRDWVFETPDGRVWIAGPPEEVMQALGMTSAGLFAFHPERRAPRPDDAPGVRRLYREFSPRSGVQPAWTMIGMNDAGYSFDEIADVLRFALEHPDVIEFRRPMLADPAPETAEEAVLASLGEPVETTT